MPTPIVIAFRLHTQQIVQVTPELLLGTAVRQVSTAVSIKPGEQHGLVTQPVRCLITYEAEHVHSPDAGSLHANASSVNCS